MWKNTVLVYLRFQLPNPFIRGHGWRCGGCFINGLIPYPTNRGRLHNRAACSSDQPVETHSYFMSRFVCGLIPCPTNRGRLRNRAACSSDQPVETHSYSFLFCHSLCVASYHALQTGAGCATGQLVLHTNQLRHIHISCHGLCVTSFHALQTGAGCATERLVLTAGLWVCIHVSFYHSMCT